MYLCLVFFRCDEKQGYVIRFFLLKVFNEVMLKEFVCGGFYIWVFEKNYCMFKERKNIFFGYDKWMFEKLV